MKKAIKSGDEIAVVVIRNAAHLTKAQLRDLVEWMHRTADELFDLKDEMSSATRFSYMVLTAPKEQAND